MKSVTLLGRLTACCLTALSLPAGAHDLTAATNDQIDAAFDIVHANITRQNNTLTFHMRVSGQAGRQVPSATGALAGSDVFSYVWPTTLNTAMVGFEADQGILAMAVTAHPDFDDTPLFDENADGKLTNDGALWHSHWVVLVPDEQCGAGALKVKDIPTDATPTLPLTWPGLPILLDSPGYSPVLTEQTVAVTVPLMGSADTVDGRYDAVTAGLRVNASAHDPLLCVVNVFDVASGDLSLPAAID